MRKLTQSQKEVLKFGIAMGLLVFLLQVVDTQRSLDAPRSAWLIGLVGLVFLITGIWVGFRMVRRRQSSTGNKKTTRPQEFGLSEREMDVLRLMAEGLSNQEIAEKLFVSRNTIKTHSSRIFSKLHAKRRTQAIQKAREFELLT